MASSYLWENAGPERWSHLLKAAQLAGAEPEFEPRPVQVALLASTGLCEMGFESLVWDSPLKKHQPRQQQAGQAIQSEASGEK